MSPALSSIPSTFSRVFFAASAMLSPLATTLSLRHPISSPALHVNEPSLYGFTAVDIVIVEMPSEPSFKESNLYWIS